MEAVEQEQTPVTEDPAQPADAPILGEAPEAQVEETPEVQKTPADYKLTAPDGSNVSQERIDEIAAYAAERGLSEEQAQDIVKFEADAVSQFATQQQEKFKEMRGEWVEQLRKDPQYGGDNFTKTCEQAKRALNRFATKELKEYLNQTGFGDNNQLVITFARIGAQMSEDTLVTGAHMPASQSKSVEELFYGSKE